MVHAPRRVKYVPGAYTSAQVRPAAELIAAWRVWSERVEAVVAGATPMRRPGRHCATCDQHGCPARDRQSDTLGLGLA